MSGKSRAVTGRRRFLAAGAAAVAGVMVSAHAQNQERVEEQSEERRRTRIYGSDLMNDSERRAYQDRMQRARTEEERNRIRDEHRRDMDERRRVRAEEQRREREERQRNLEEMHRRATPGGGAGGGGRRH
ncbi:MAG: hypothetical protein GC151_15140 [Betaproteobacteria bacterium]|nr:hypothetical protein [Betaproteobacteria bacterium]